jgi:hypothetical protein
MNLILDFRMPRIEIFDPSRNQTIVRHLSVEELASFVDHNFRKWYDKGRDIMEANPNFCHFKRSGHFEMRTLDNEIRPTMDYIKVDPFKKGYLVSNCWDKAN